MTDMLLSAIAQSKDRTWLTRCGDYNLREGRNDVATAVDQRLGSSSSTRRSRLGSMRKRWKTG